MIALIIPNLGPFIGIVGALCLATLGLFIPSVIEIVTFWEEEDDYWRLSKNIFIMLFSLMTTVSGCSVSIQEVIHAYLIWVSTQVKKKHMKLLSINDEILHSISRFEPSSSLFYTFCGNLKTQFVTGPFIPRQFVVRQFIHNNLS